jgi:hypothetical protein
MRPFSEYDIMKKSILISASLVLAGAVVAQNLNLPVQQARRVAGQNDAEQQRLQRAEGEGGGAAPGMANPAANDPALQATLKNISGLQSDFAAFTQSDKPDDAQKASLLNNLSGAAQGAKAKDESVKKLAGDLTAAIAGQKNLLAPQQARLAREVHAMFNGSHLTDALQAKLLTDIQKTLTASGCSSDSVQAIITDLKTIASETK